MAKKTIALENLFKVFQRLTYAKINIHMIHKCI